MGKIIGAQIAGLSFEEAKIYVKVGLQNIVVDL